MPQTSNFSGIVLLHQLCFMNNVVRPQFLQNEEGSIELHKPDQPWQIIRWFPIVISHFHFPISHSQSLFSTFTFPFYNLLLSISHFTLVFFYFPFFFSHFPLFHSHSFVSHFHFPLLHSLLLFCKPFFFPFTFPLSLLIFSHFLLSHYRFSFDLLTSWTV